MFAFALFDEERQRLLLARDRVGIKPLYYSFDGKALRFASEAKALVQTAPRLLSPDPRSMVDFFALSVIQEGRTAFEGISELQPGAHPRLGSQTASRARTATGGRPTPARPVLSGDELTAAVSGLLTDAVRSHLVSDVPVGTYLSGGLDSSLVSAIADDYITGLNTFSAGFVGEEKVDERVYAREMAASIGSDHHEVEVGPENFLANLQEDHLAHG